MRRFKGCQELNIQALDLSVFVARSYRSRVLGLAGLDRMDVGAALLLPACRSVHTFGMRFPIDVAFLAWPPRAGAARVVSVREGLKPMRVASLGARAAALELVAGGVARCGLGVGDVIVLEAVQPGRAAV